MSKPKMSIVDLYSGFIKAFEKTGKKDFEKAVKSDPRLSALRDMAVEWGQDPENICRWMASPEYRSQEELAKRFIIEAPSVIEKVQKVFGCQLQGELRLSPSMMRFDGFARYDSGSHSIWFGVDHPDANDDYLRVLLSHELSHVYRDHQPDVWGHLKKPLEEVTRDEYLEAGSAHEHLASEGLATLNSQVVYPKVPIHVHHYYLPQEMQWCMDHFNEIDVAIRNCLKGDQNVWKFYEEDVVATGSPSRTQYFWAAKVLADWLPKKTGLDLREAVLKAHGWVATEFTCFDK